MIEGGVASVSAFMILGIPAMQPGGEGVLSPAQMTAPLPPGSSDPAAVVDGPVVAAEQQGGVTEAYGGVGGVGVGGGPLDDEQPVASSSENGHHRMPPQQVYVNPAGGPIVDGVPGGVNMTGLESQFQSLGFQADGGTGKASNSAPTAGESDTAEDNDETETEEDPPVKLFVGQVSDSWYR